MIIGALCVCAQNSPRKSAPSADGNVTACCNSVGGSAADSGKVQPPHCGVPGSTVTPGRDVLFPAGSLRPGQHVSLMGADGPGKAEIAVEELARARVFCDDWEQASHGGECAPAVAAGLLTRDDVTELGRVLTGESEGRRSPEEATAFDSTGLALQDLAVALVALERADELDLPRIDL